VLQLYVNYEHAQLLEMEVRLFVFEQPNPRLADFEQRRGAWFMISGMANLLHHAIYWPTAIFFLVWLAQASKNTQSLQAEGLTHIPLEAVLFFFFPVVNLFRPYFIVQEIWRSSDPRTIATPRSWLSSPPSKAIRVWWLAFLAGVALSIFSHVLAMQGFNHEQLQGAALVRCVSNLCMIAAGVSLVFIIRTLMQRQTQRYIRLYEDPA
jgi:hypothetical protein